MSANASTAMQGQSSNVGPLGAAAVLTAVVAFGALGFALGQGVATTTTTAARPVAGPVIDNTSMSGPRSAAQKGLGGAAIVSGVDGRFAAQYEQWVAVQEAARHGAEISATKDADASIVLPINTPYSGTDFAGQYAMWLKAQSMALGSDFPDLYQRSKSAINRPYTGSDFAGQYANWLKVQAATADASFPDYFQRHAPAAASLDFPDYFQRHTAPVAGGTGGRGVRLAQ
jgi:hypothetical protein